MADADPRDSNVSTFDDNETYGAAGSDRNPCDAVSMLESLFVQSYEAASTSFANAKDEGSSSRKRSRHLLDADRAGRLAVCIRNALRMHDSRPKS